MKHLISIFFFFLLANCSGYSIASLGSNIATYAATGKTNSDHAVSYVTGKDCRITRAIVERNYCEEKNLFIVENEKIEKLNENEIAEGLDVASLNIIKSDSNLIIEDNVQKGEEKIQLAFVDIVVNSFYYGSLTWAENQIIKGALVSDKIGLTQDLTTFVEQTFDYYFY